jgi:hypothetical protein
MASSVCRDVLVETCLRAVKAEEFVAACWIHDNRLFPFPFHMLLDRSIATKGAQRLAVLLIDQPRLGVVGGKRDRRTLGKRACESAVGGSRQAAALQCP